jgi:putative ABC transport system substrate-binding protein
MKSKMLLPRSAERGGGLIVLPSAPITAQIEHVIEATARYRIPAVYPFGSHAKRGGLIALGVELNDLFGQAASYVDRILKERKTCRSAGASADTL